MSDHAIASTRMVIVTCILVFGPMFSAKKYDTEWKGTVPQVMLYITAELALLRKKTSGG